MNEKRIGAGAPAWHDRMTTPVGELVLGSDARGAITGVWFPGEVHAPADLGRRDGGPFTELRSQLDQYFAGTLRSFAVPTAAVGTPFQRMVWAELGRIGYGEVTTYRDLAIRLGRPGRLGRWARRARATRSGYSFPVIASSASRAASPAMQAASPPSAG